MIDQLIFTDEAAVAGVPVPFLTLHTVGPTIMRFGTAEQRTLVGYSATDIDGRKGREDERLEGRHEPDLEIRRREATKELPSCIRVERLPRFVLDGHHAVGHAAACASAVGGSTRDCRR